MNRELKYLIGPNSPIRVLLAGFGPLSIALFRNLLNSPDTATVVGLIPASNLKHYRFLKEHPSEIELIRVANEHHVRILTAAGINSPQFKNELADLKPHILLVGGWSEIIKPEILATSGLTSINCHGSLLPKYRGACPYVATIFNGDRRTGITFHLIDEGIDTGDILLQKKFDVDNCETALQLERRMAEKFGESIIALLNGLKSGHICSKKQSGIPSYVSKHQPEWGWIPWEEDPKVIDRRMRALQGFLPLATSLRGQVVGFEKGRVTKLDEAQSDKSNFSVLQFPTRLAPGTVLKVDSEKLIVSTRNPVCVVELSLPAIVPGGQIPPVILPGTQLYSIECSGISRSA